MMFVESELTWMVIIRACGLKSDLDIQDAVLRKLLADFNEVKCSESHGYHICVTTFEEISERKAWELKGWTAYRVRFRCLTYKPLKHEMGLAVVTGLNQEKGVMCSLGPMDMVFVSFKFLGDKYEFIPAKERTPARFQGIDGTVIETGSVLRAQIVDIRYNSRFCEFEAICMMKGVEKRTWEDTSEHQPSPYVHDGCEDGSGQEVDNAGGSDDSPPSVLKEFDTTWETESFSSLQNSALGKKSVKLCKGKGHANAAERYNFGKSDSPEKVSGDGSCDFVDQAPYLKSYATGSSYPPEESMTCFYPLCYCRYER